MTNILDVTPASRRALRTAALAAGAALTAGSTGAEPKWVELKSAHFTAISDAGEGAARRTLWQFEQIRAALARVWPWAKVDSGMPFYIYAVRNEATIKTLGPEYWEGKRFRPVSFWTTGRDRRFIALRTDIRDSDNANENPYQSAYWSYVNTVLAGSFPRPLPAWYSRGVSEVWSNTRVREKEIHVGRAIQRNVDRAREGGLIRFDAFLAAERKSRWLTGESEIELFDAQAWAFVHYLMFGESAAHSAKLNRFSTLLMGGATHEVALREAFGDVKPYFDNIHLYVNQSVLPFARVAVSLDLDVETFGSRNLMAAEAALQRAEFLVAMDRPVEARALAAEAAQADPQSPGPFEIEAQLLDRAGQDDKAKEAFAKAVELGSTRAFVHYRLAQLEWRPAFDEAHLKRQEARLRRAHELDPRDTNAMSFLADTLSALGRPQEALPLARQAVERDPSSFYHRTTLARVARDLGSVEDALRIAESALAAADDDDERQRAQGFLDSLRRESQASGPREVEAAGGINIPTVAGVPTENSAKLVRVAGSHVVECFSRRNAEECTKAAPELEAACQSGQALACRSLGSLYDGGWGVASDKSRAAELYALGCRAEDASSCARLAVLEATGQGVTHEPVKGVSTLQRLCGQQVDDACIGWALVLVSQSGRDGLAKARSLLEATCSRKNEEACSMLATLPR